MRVSLPGPEATITLDVPPGAAVAGLRLHYGAAPRVPVERAEILKETETGLEIVWATEPDWPALTELVSGLLETRAMERRRSIWMPPPLYRETPASPVRSRLRVPELTEIEALAAAPAVPGTE